MTVHQLVQLLRTQVIPWAQTGQQRHFIVARPVMDQAELPEDASLTPHEIAGKRQVIKDKRKHGNQRNFVAEWPQSNLHEIALPKLACSVHGITDYFIGEHCLHCGPGHFILMPPHVPHQQRGPFLGEERQQNGESCVLLHAYAYQHGVLFWYSRSEGDRHINESVDNYLIPSTTASLILGQLMEEALAERGHFYLVGSGLLLAFFAVVVRELEAGNYMHPGPAERINALSQNASGFAGQVQEYIEANCHRMLRVEHVATHMYMSTSQFSRRIRRETGTTFVELLTAVRIERACKLLRETDTTVAHIASFLSFRSVTYFQNLFRQRMGCTPVQYRRDAQRAPAKPLE
jgi:AraC-like DNA-binding protein